MMIDTYKSVLEIPNIIFFTIFIIVYFILGLVLLPAHSSNMATCY